MLMRRWHRHAQRRLLACVLLTVLAMQWLALAHAVRHAGHVTQAVSHATQDVLGGEHDAGTPVCQMLDHLLSGQGAAPSMAPPSSQAAQALPQSSHATIIAGAVASAYFARAPPHAA